METPVWLNSAEGKTDEVLHPWRPIEISEDEVRVWGRAYGFSDTSLLSAVKSQGKSLLSAPVRLVGSINGNPVEWRGSHPEMTSQTPARVEMQSTAGSSGLMLEAKTSVEYDGMIRTDIRLTPDTPLTLNELVLEITLPAEHAKYLYTCPNGIIPQALPPTAPRNLFPIRGVQKPGRLEPNSRMAGNFVPFVWLGDEEVGLQWFCESDLNWYCADPTECIEILHRGDEVVARMSLVDVPVKMRPGKPARKTQEGRPVMEPPDQVGDLEYTFGFHATPVKPVERDCWDHRLVSPPWYGHEYWLLTKDIRSMPALDYLKEKGVRAVILWNWTDLMTYTKPVGHEEELRKVVQEAHERGIKVITYFGFQINEECPEWPEYGQQAIMQETSDNPTRKYADLYTGMKPAMVDRVCYAGVWQDFLVDGIAKLMDEYDTDGVYLDTTVRPFACLNGKHGCGYVKPDGSIEHTYRIFAVRDTLRRIYTVVKTRKPEGLVDAHLAGALNMPALSWATSFWNGEMLKALGDSPILETVPLEYFRVEMVGNQWGVPAEFLHYTLFPKYRPDDFRKSMAIPLLHDIPVRPHMSLDDILETATDEDIDYRANLAVEALDLVSSLWRLFDEFGRKESEWLPYWRNAHLITTPDGIYASLYRHPENGLLAVLANLGASAEDVEARLPSGARATDALTGETVTLTNGVLHTKIPYLGWKIIRVESCGT